MAHQDPLALPEIKNTPGTTPPSPLENPVKKFLVPLGVGVVVFGSVTAFAASLGVSSTSLGAGNGTVASCNATANVSYTSAFDTTSHVYELATTTVNTVAGSPSACSGKTYKITFLDSSNAPVGTEVTGTLAANGSDTKTVSAQHVAALLVENLAVVITG